VDLRLRHSGSFGLEAPIDLVVDWHIAVASAENPVVCGWQDWGEGGVSPAHVPGVHHGLQLLELMLELRDLWGQALHHTGVPHLGGLGVTRPQRLATFKSTQPNRPKLCLLLIIRWQTLLLYLEVVDILWVEKRQV